MGRDFPCHNLQNFRKFYLAYPERCAAIGYPMGSQSAITSPGKRIPRPMGAESSRYSNSLTQRVRNWSVPKKSYPAGSESPQGFSPQLSWSHYRALMRVETSRRAISTSARPSRAAGTSGRWSGRSSRTTTSASSRAASRRRCWRKDATAGSRRSGRR